MALSSSYSTSPTDNSSRSLTVRRWGCEDAALFWTIFTQLPLSPQDWGLWPNSVGVEGPEYRCGVTTLYLWCDQVVSVVDLLHQLSVSNPLLTPHLPTSRHLLYRLCPVPASVEMSQGLSTDDLRLADHCPPPPPPLFDRGPSPPTTAAGF